jgi:uncharacterized membrane protein YcaP (DUF421 family)
MDMQVTEEDLCTAVIIDGKFSLPDISKYELSEKYLKKTLKTFGFNNIKEIILCTFSDIGEIYVQDKKGESKNIRLPPSALPKERQTSSQWEAS